ncbi:MAG: hypothetical protein ACUVV6_01000 [Thermoplasmatota archaeon]
MAACALAGSLSGPSPVFPAVLAAGALSALIELDRTPQPPYRTPLGHSAPAALLWSLAVLSAAFLSAPELAPPAAIACASAFVSHLALDSLTADGVFLWPRDPRLATWALARDPSRVAELDGDSFFIGGSGEGPWAGWRRFSLAALDDGSPLLNTATSAAGLVIVLTAIALA